MSGVNVVFDYKAEFHDAVTDLIAEEITDRGERMAAVHALTEAYVDSVGIAPDATELARLSDYILREELTDKRRNKVQDEDYPFLSESQLDRRHDHEYSLSLAETYDLAGANQAKPERRHRTAREERFIDRAARRKNRARNAKYRRDTSPGPIIDGASASFTQSAGIGAKWSALIGREEIVAEDTYEKEMAA
ncbi:hypothetical protein DFP94_101523 [Fontibacillus phaseoli]|uniref:Uncharacterized protein n=1 Tax=Fontibacillus phaseoli TaxID=1416533 RepID=A0A369BTJ6_9BACL|nr:hypothetical protein [Fontibacillus phaseoli]RCX22934.1 hypothetical protein DFP94_101523 [Fontibacillus phaseoli]